MSNVTSAKYVWMSGTLVEWKQATVHLASSLALYGAGVFEGIRAYKSPTKPELCVFRVDDHLKRLFLSAKVHRMKIPFSIKEIEGAIIETIRKNKFVEDSYIRPLIYPGNYLELLGGEPPIEVSILTFPLRSGEQLEKAKKGIRCCISNWRKISDSSLPPRVKSCANYVNYLKLAKKGALSSGFDDAILLTNDGKVSEASGSNIFLVRENKLITPDLASDILEGVTRNTIIEIAKRDLGYTLEERAVARTELYHSDEVFLCGTAKEITPVISIDNILVGNGSPGELTRKIQKRFFEIVRGKATEYKKWLIPVYT